MMRCVILILFCSAIPRFATCAETDGPLFSKMAAGESMTVNFRSQGCFHDHKIYFVLERRAEGMVASLWNFERDPKDRNIETTKAAGSLTLTDEQIKGLDETLLYYRGKPRGGCTTVELVEFVWKRKDSKDEKYTDGSCSIGDRIGPLSFMALSGLIEEKNAPQTPLPVEAKK